MVRDLLPRLASRWPTLGCHGCRPHGADADAQVIETVLGQPSEQISELGMLGDGCSQQAQGVWWLESPFSTAGISPSSSDGVRKGSVR